MRGFSEICDSTGLAESGQPVKYKHRVTFVYDLQVVIPPKQDKPTNKQGIEHIRVVFFFSVSKRVFVQIYSYKNEVWLHVHMRKVLHEDPF